MNEISRRWVEAGKILAADPSAKVRCPQCGGGVLEVEDVGNPVNSDEFERYLRCPICGARNVLRMRHPKP
jgi:DNA-directed RNA polymerase subunit RPC12/RpoP